MEINLKTNQLSCVDVPGTYIARDAYFLAIYASLNDSCFT